MACGCQKNKAVQSPPKTSISATTYDVLRTDGSKVASYTNPVTARAEARRIGGTVVTSSQSSAPPAEITNSTSETN